MSEIHSEASDQIQSAYEVMAAEANYFPYSDPDLPMNQRDIPEERYRYEKRWWEQENTGTYNIGMPSHDHREALIYTIEAAENITAWSPERAKKLLQLAIEEIDRLAAEEAASEENAEPEQLTFTAHLHEPAYGGETGRLAQDDITAVKVNPHMTVQQLAEKVFVRSLGPWGGQPIVRPGKYLVIRPEIDINEDLPW